MPKATRKKASSEPKATKGKSGGDAPPLDTSIAEDTIAAPRHSRKRSGDFFDFSGEDDATGAPSNKATSAKALKPKKKSKVAPVADDDTKPSKVDGHPVTTAKTHPGGDMVEVEPTKPSRRGKAKESKDEAIGSSAIEPPKAAEKAKKARKSKKTETEVPVKATTSKAGVKKSKAPSSEEPKARAKKPRVASNDGSNATTQKLKKATDDGSKTSTKKSKKTPKDDGVEEDDTVQPSESALNQGPLDNLPETGDKGKKPASKSLKPTKSSEPAKRPGRKPKQSQVSASVDKSEVKPSEGKKGEKGEKAPDAAESSKKPTKPRKPKTAKDSTTADGNPQLTAAEPVKNSDNVNSGPAKPEASKSKKRKNPVSAETDALHAQVLDPLSEHASAKKKQKKSALEAPASSLGNVLTSGQDTVAQGLETASEVLHSKILDPLSEEASSTKKKQRKSKPGVLQAAGSKLGDILASGLDTAAQGVAAAKDYAAEVANGAQKSIMGDITEVAEAVVDEKDKAEALAKKPSNAVSKKGRNKKIKGDIVSAEPSSKAAVVDAKAETQAPAMEDEDEEDFEDEDQTLALLKGFDTGDDDGISGDEGYKQDDEIPEIPDVETTALKLKAANDEADGPGVIFVGYTYHFYC